MAVLSNVDIERFVKEGKIKIIPFEKGNVQGATIDLTLKNEFLIPTYYDSPNRGRGFITLDDKLEYKKIKSDWIDILPQHFILGSTLETIIIPNDLSIRIDGKSKIGRRGLFIQNAGHGGPGFKGEITLELYNANQIPIRLEYKQKICQIEIHKLSSPSTKPYSGKYLRQKGPTI